MIQNTLQEIKSKLNSAKDLEAARRDELLQLLVRLETEIAERERQNLKPLKLSVEELQTSVEGFEQSHPKLVQAVNSISNTLSSLGI